jgi:hypothetical protein
VGQLKDAQYLVFPSGDRPYLLACVRWPDIALAISTHCTAWREDQGLFDLPYEPGAQVVSAGEAAAIAAAWGGELPADSALVDAELALHRRMPANWSHLSPVERRAWLPRRPPVARPPRIAAVQAAPGFAVLEGVEVAEPYQPVLDGAGDGQASGPDRRRYERVTARGRVILYCGHRKITADLVDVSLGGARCAVSDDVTDLDSVTTVTPLVIERAVGGPPLMLDVPCVVVWKRPGDGGAHHLGVQFGELGDRHLEGLRELIAAEAASR